MTPKDVRDIMAYYGATCYYQLANGGEIGTAFHVNSELLAELEGNRVAHFKLHLRPLSSLTDDEKYECFRLAFGVDARTCGRSGIDDDGDKTQVWSYLTDDRHVERRLDLSMWQGGQIAATGWIARNGTGYYSPIWNSHAVTAYLQFIGIYLPGIINPNYVQLIEP